MLWVENATTRDMREKLFPNLPKTDEMDARVMTRIAYLHEAVGEEFTLRPVVLPAADDADLLALCRDSWKLTGMMTRARNQFTQLMAMIFPELKTFFVSSVSSPAVVRLIATYPTPADLAAAAPEAVATVLHKARAHSHAQRVEELHDLASHSVGIVPDVGRAWRLAWLSTFLEHSGEALASLDRRVHEAVTQKDGYQLLHGIPYSGDSALGVILAVTGDIHRFANYRQYVAYSGYFAGLETSQTIDRTRMSTRGNRDLKRALFQIVAPMVWYDPGTNPYKALYERKVAEGRPWYKAMPFACAALARHIYHCLKEKDPYDVTKVFRRSRIPRASHQVLAALQEDLDEKFEILAVDPDQESK
jgi:hypothetical protein